MRDNTGLSGCILLIMGIVALFAFAIPTGFSWNTSAIQATQLYSAATMWTTLLAVLGIGLLLLAVDQVRIETTKALSPGEEKSTEARPTAWEYRDLMEEIVSDAEASTQRRVCRMVSYGEGGPQEQPVSNRAESLSLLAKCGWELVSAYVVPRGKSVTETHWVFRRET